MYIIIHDVRIFGSKLISLTEPHYKLAKPLSCLAQLFFWEFHKLLAASISYLAKEACCVAFSLEHPISVFFYTLSALMSAYNHYTYTCTIMCFSLKRRKLSCVYIFALLSLSCTYQWHYCSSREPLRVAVVSPRTGGVQ